MHLSKFTLSIASLVVATLSTGAVEYPSFESNGHKFSCRSVKSSSSTSFEKGTSSHSVSLRGFYHIPSVVTKDIIAADLDTYNPSIVDRQGNDLLDRNSLDHKKSTVYCPIHDIGEGGETANKAIHLKYSLSDEAIKVDTLSFTLNALEVQKRELIEWEPLVSEEYMEAVEGLYVRVAALSLKNNREFKVEISYKRESTGLESPFFEGVQVLDAEGRVIGGGRWTYGNPLETDGKFTAKFKLVSPDMHHMIRLVIVSEARVIPIKFEVKGIFDQ